MSTKLINTSATGINNNFITILSSPTQVKYRSILDGYNLLPTGSFDRLEQNPKGMFSLGTGTIVGTSAISLYDTEISGSGLIENLLLINRSNTTVFVGINTYNMTVANGVPISSGESYVFENNIHNAWAITSGGSAILAGGGPYFINGNNL